MVAGGGELTRGGGRGSGVCWAVLVGFWLGSFGEYSTFRKVVYGRMRASTFCSFCMLVGTSGTGVVYWCTTF